MLKLPTTAVTGGSQESEALTEEEEVEKEE